MTNPWKLKNENDEKIPKYQEKYNLQTNPNNPGGDDQVDAFRHAFTSAQFTVVESKEYAKTWGDRNEKYSMTGSAAYPTSTNMDNWNNAVGREIGEEIKKEMGDLKNIPPEKLDDIIAQKVMERMEKGDLITDPKDPRKFEDYGKTKIQGKSTGGAASIPKPKKEKNPAQKPEWKPEKPEIIKKKFRSDKEKIVGYRWVAEGDACDECQSLDGTEYDSEYDVPGQPHPNCKCTVEPIYSSDAKHSGKGIREWSNADVGDSDTEYCEACEEEGQCEDCAEGSEPLKRQPGQAIFLPESDDEPRTVFRPEVNPNDFKMYFLTQQDISSNSYIDLLKRLNFFKIKF